MQVQSCLEVQYAGDLGKNLRVSCKLKGSLSFASEPLPRKTEKNNCPSEGMDPVYNERNASNGHQERCPTGLCL